MEIQSRNLKEIGDQILTMLRPIVSRGKSLSLESEIYKELNLRGDDAEDFILAISDAFRVDMDNFEMRRYFPDEGAAIMEWPLKMFGLRSSLDSDRYASLTIIDLAQMITEKIQQQNEGKIDTSL